MSKLSPVQIDTHQRGDSGVIRWSWKRQSGEGEISSLSLAGFKVALTVKRNLYDSSVEDTTAEQGYNNTLWKIDIDCDNADDMHGIDPTLGMVIFPIPKQAAWIDAGTYYLDIVVENKASHRTKTVFLGKIEIQGHPTNRLTTDAPDNYDDLES